MTQRDPFVSAGWAAWAIVAVLLILVPAYCHQARAEEGVRFSEESCATLAVVVEQALDARAAGIEKKQYLAYMAARMERGGSSRAAGRVMLAEIARAYAASVVESEKLTLDAYTRCMTGPMGAGTDI